MREWLVDGFSYDQWANARWAPIIDGPMANDSVAQSIWLHMLGCHKNWYARTLSPEDIPALPESTSDSLQIMAEAWKDLVRTSDPTAYIAYQTAAGDHYFNMVEEIAQQVTNHGTYHRGQLRALAEASGVDFPETDYVLWKREVNTAPA